MNELERMNNNIKRAGKSYLNRKFSPYRDVSHYNDSPILLSAKDALDIFNTIGVSEKEILLMCLANGLDGFEEEEFNILLNEQKEQSKKMKQCGEK